MIQRFQIEDLMVQDASGVIFRALDLETGKVVALRRFFPFGADGGGLHAEEQTAYTIAVSRLAGLSHPALRSVVCGGCDPVDGMPFIATEWIEGETLESTLASGPLDASAAVQLVTQALEVSELISHALAEEAVWVETEIQSIVVGTEASGRGFTFWISPLKWLGRDDRSRGLESIVTLTEQVMGWQERLVNDQAGRGLGSWVKWLSTVSGTTTLLEARESLAASVSAEPPVPARNLVVKATTRPLVRPAVPLKSHSSKAPILVACLLSLIVAGVGAFMWKRQSAAETLVASQDKPAVLSKQAPAKSKEKAKPKDIQPLKRTISVADKADPRKEIEKKSAKWQEDSKLESSQKEETLRAQQAAAEQQGGVMLWNQKELLLAHKNKVVVISGTPTEVDTSKDEQKTVYLIFGTKEGGDFFRAGMERNGLPVEEAKKLLEPFLNKKLEIKGEIKKRMAGKNKFDPEMIFTDPLLDIKIKE